MKTKDYIKEFKLDLENYEFNREEFIRALGKEFLDRLELIHIARVNKGMDFPFKVFQELVKEMQTNSGVFLIRKLVNLLPLNYFQLSMQVQ